MPSFTKVQTGFLEAINPFTLDIGTASAPGLKFSDSSATGMFSPSTGALAFSTGSTQNALTILSGGNVGIGSTNPGSKLVVVGTISATTFSGALSGNAATVTTNANLTGHITSVGNAAVLGSFTSAQLATALTDETGTGVAVFATSPTLVTPVLGAATGTSLNLSTTLGVTGASTLAAVTATNTTFAPTVNTYGFRIKPTTGALLDLNSQSTGIDIRVLNNSEGDFLPLGVNANVLTILQRSGPGATSPVAVFNSTGLAVTGAISATTGATFATTSGNVGIGTTNPSFGKLDIAGAMENQIRINNTNETGHGTVNAKFVAGGSYYQILDFHASNYTFKTYDGSNISDRIKITSGGDLHSVWGDGRFMGSFYDANYYMGFTFGASSRELFIDNKSNDTRADIVFRTLEGAGTPTERLRITSTGNVGIGTTNPSAKLHIGIENEPNISLQSLFVQGTKTGYAGIAGLPQNQLVIYDDTPSTLNSGGAIGFAANTGSSQRTWIASINSQRESSSNNGTNYAGALVFYTRPAQSTPLERLRISSTGNVGIGTTNPSQKLQVSGNLFVSGTPTYGSQLYVSANAASDPNGNEANATTGWATGFGGATISSVGTENGVSPNVGSYQLKYQGTNNGDRQDYAFNVVAGKRYVVTFNSRWYQGSLYTIVYVATSNVGDNLGSAISTIESTLSTSYEQTSLNFRPTVSGTVYLCFRMASTSNPINITYIDNISIREEIGGEIYGNNQYLGGNLTSGGIGNNYFAGNVGIGTTNPSEKLEVSGYIKMSDTPGTNTNAELDVLFQTATGVIDGGSGLTYNPASDYLKVGGGGGNTIYGQGSLLVGASGPYTIAAANHSNTVNIKVSDKIEFNGNLIIQSYPTTNSSYQTNTTFISHQRSVGINQSSWYYLQIGGDSYSRSASFRLRVNWTTGHASGVAYHESHVQLRNRHDNAKCDVMEFGRLREAYFGGTYYGWASNPTVYIYNSDYTYASAGVWIRIDGHMSSGGYDGYVVHHIFMELYGNHQIVVPTLLFNSNTAPANVGAQATPIQL